MELIDVNAIIMASDKNITRVSTGKTRIYRKNDNIIKGHHNNGNSSNHVINWLVIGVSGFLLGLFYQKLVIEGEIIQKNGSSSSFYASQEESWKPRESLDRQKIAKEKSAQDRVSDYLREQQENGHGESFSLGRTAVINGFLKDEEEMRTLANPLIWEELFKDGTKWMDSNDGFKEYDIWQQLARRIWESNELAKNIAGYEYWCNIVNTSVPLDWHVDKDEAAFQQEHQTLKYPKMGAVFYGFPHSMRGGYLELADAGILDQHPNEFGGEIERIRAEYNRLVILNVTNWHRVSAITNVDGVRFTFAVNIWDEKPMEYL